MERRRVLQLMTISSGVGPAGCTYLGDDDTATPEEDDGNEPENGNEDDDSEAGVREGTQ